MEIAPAQNTGAARTRANPGSPANGFSHIVLKGTMAVSGLLMFAFLIAHLSGNLLVFSSRAAMNDYAAFLHSKPPLLWGARIGLLVAVVTHFGSGFILARSSQSARRISYTTRRYQKSSLASRTMLISGLWILIFLVIHLLHFTTGTIHPHYQAGRPFENLVDSFQSPIVVAGYVLTMGLISAHLFHGLWSSFQTLGWNGSRRNRLLRISATVLSVGLGILFSTVPLAISAGLVGGK